MKPILCLDFDGVLHSYTSGWKGARVIPDPPVPGALEFVVGALERFQVAILSSRSHAWFGRYAMKRWLRNNLYAIGIADDVPRWWADYICEGSAMEPWAHEVYASANRVIKTIQWPLHKPPAMVTIDDRAITFSGEWPSLDGLRAFKTWQKKAV